jgi:single-strand DNA-binding protein
MARSVNKVILIGNLGKDPEVRRMENNIAKANFTIATSESYRDRNTNEMKTITDWHNIVVWRGLADVAEKYLKKGMQVYIEGKLKTRSYTDQNNVTKYVTEVVADNLVMLTRGNNEGQGANPSSAPSTSNEDMSGVEYPISGPEDDLPF